MDAETRLTQWRSEGLSLFGSGSWRCGGLSWYEREESFRIAILTYLLRQLSRGTVPSLDVLRPYIEDGIPIPDCGHLGCNMFDGEPHVH